MLVVLKGLPMTYGKDMQEDKEPIFDAADTLMLVLPASTAMIVGMTADADAMRAMTRDGFLTATDLADWLVRELDLPFRDAHLITGAIVKLAETKGLDLKDLTLDDLRGVEPRLDERVYDALDIERAVAGRMSEGGTAPERVKAAVTAARERFL